MKDDSVICPVEEIIDRCRPKDIIVVAEKAGSESVMGSIDIEPIFKDTRFTIRYVFVVRQVGIEYLFLHIFIIKERSVSGTMKEAFAFQ